MSWPISNMGTSLPNLLATVAGNLFELRQFSALRLLDLTLPAAFAGAYLGPQFGIAGTRALSGVAAGPLIGTIIKPSVGLTPEATAEAVRALAAGGIDFIKDDELQSDGPHNPLAARIAAVMPVLEEHAARSVVVYSALGRDRGFVENLGPGAISFNRGSASSSAQSCASW